MNNLKQINKNDLRSIKTEKAIRTAFHQLAQEKEVNKITVRELAQRAEINKTTFYAHYDTILDFVKTLENETIDYIINNLAEFQRLFDDPTVFIDNLYRSLSEYQFDNIFHLNANSSYFSEKIDTAIKGEMSRLNIDTNQYRKYRLLAVFIMNGLLALLRNQNQVTASDVEYIKSFVKGGIHSII
ncbi:TetR/AcrR family transcriptional regulator [Enterococcus casseliflavus]|uniref:TetR/AcrR family transcriptional regulator n=1 Tax=Enterococcus casseliflavus TaxID=37734 RepID=UPI001784B88A|nr:TetR family transcriptional regulator [Enterococcus casseliflavus]QOG29391.1 TetR/AcrR family transcriptional regulator [Enterococcus casseliflavus]